jgi:site-specific DNA-methyltransferase (adenine-specific)
MTPYYEDNHVTIYHADCREVYGLLNLDDVGCLILDPPYDEDELFVWAAGLRRFESEFVFTDPRHLGDVTSWFGPPVWVFTWDTMSPWTVGPSRPLTQTKFALWYGALDEYDRDAVLWGDAPRVRAHPSTKQQPLDGRRLTDLWRESLRWLHNPSAGTGGAERFSRRQGEHALKHAKPVGWMRCLIGNTSSPEALVLDPFMGSGSSLRAAKDTGRRAIGIDVDERCCEFAAKRMAQEVLF